MNILCAADDNYVPYLGIMLTSLFENNKDNEIHVYILTDKLSESNVVILHKLAQEYDKNIEIINIDISQLGNCPIRPSDHVSIATYYRLIAADILPDEIERIIYLDCDLIVDSDLTDLWNIDMGGKMMGAVFDENYQDPKIYERLDYPSDRLYACAGVLLIDLKKWRERGATKQCAECINNYSDNLLFHDQDVINKLFHNDIFWLHPRYDLQCGHLYAYVVFPNDKMSEIKEAIKAPSIIHFTGPKKPWHFSCKHPYRSYFIYYKDKSLWRDLSLQKDKLTLTCRIRKIFIEVIWLLGLKKRPRTYIIPNQCKKTLDLSLTNEQ